MSPKATFYPDSFLSPQAQNLFLACNCDFPLSPENKNCPCVTSDGFLVMDAVGCHLCDYVAKGDYFSAVRSISHTMHLCSHNFNVEAFKVNEHSLNWLTMPSHFANLRNLALKQNSVDRLLSMLQLISMLDFSLSRLLVDERGRSPNHFTAVIEDPRLATFLTPPTLSVLKLLFGPPTSLNLRNLFWHGFVSPSDYYMHKGHIVPRINELDVRPDGLNPLTSFVVASCGLWSSWASLYRAVSELNPTRRVNDSLIESARLWFPDLPSADDIMIHSLEDASKFLPSVNISRLWLWKVHYMDLLAGSSEGQRLSSYQCEKRNNLFKVALRLAALMRRFDAYVRVVCQSYSTYVPLAHEDVPVWKKAANKKSISLKKFCDISVPALLASLSVPILCCCHIKGIWDSWFAGDFISNEATASPQFILPKDYSALITCFEVLEARLTATIGTHNFLKIHKILALFKLPHPQ
uniref:DUF4209 domain-containing protein n=1 Tax=Mesocestoides corti TaxID=53468 RepID=A0A5K3FNM8_MESCO